MIGRELDGRYRILSQLGEGAMGEVYLVEHIGLGRREALKILRSSMDDSPALVTRFRREARATNRLQHPNIVSVYDFGRLPDGRFYITTEFVDGETLDDLVKRLVTLPVSRAQTILHQLADAVDHAHGRGVIHRDLKPANLIIAQERNRDVVKVLDFGVAKIIAPDYAETLAATGQGEVFGTPAYMAPEQIHAKGNDPRIDIYAFGCIAFELVTGKPPFSGRTLQVLNAHINTPPPRASERAPKQAIPRALDELIDSCLRKDPDKRPQTGAEIVKELNQIAIGTQALLAAETLPKRSPRGQRRSSLIPDLTIPDTDADSRWVTSYDQIEEITEPGEDLSMAPTGFSDRSESRLAVDSTLIQLAETLIDSGCNEFQLTLTVANIAGARGALDSVVSRIDELERSREAVAQRAKESEQRFRFAVGELRFELEQARSRGVIAPDTEFQVQQLETRMAELSSESEAEQAAIDDRAISLAAERATREEELAGLLGQLEQLVDEIAPRFKENPHITELLERLERLR